MFNYKGFQGALGAWGFKGNGESSVEYEAAEILPNGGSRKVDF